MQIGRLIMTTQDLPITEQSIPRKRRPLGVEYVFLTVALLSGALGLIITLIALLNSVYNFSLLAVPVSILVVALPVFVGLFRRLLKAEKADPSLRHAILRRLSMLTIQIASFLTCFIAVIVVVAAFFAFASGSSASFSKLFISLTVVLIVAGTILFYSLRK